jgi:predicted metal-dependent hydrolase
MTRDIEVVRHPRARRAKLAVDPRSGVVTLTLPPRAALKPALRWAEEQAAWVAAARAKLPTPRPFVPGAVLPVDDAELIITWRPGAARRVQREGALLTVGGDEAGLSRRVTTWLKREALRLLSDDTAFFAARAGVSVSRVSVGDPGSRWGSCAGSGAIRYSWRLVLAPRFVRRATAAHEVAHRLHMDHSPAFHAAAAAILGDDPAPARRWLKANGAALHWFGRAP